jgi:hypothetical protein
MIRNINTKNIYVSNKKKYVWWQNLLRLRKITLFNVILRNITK